MGRGRQKAKDAKIARQIKYGVHGADLRELERELVVGQASSTSRAQSPSSHEPDDNPDDLDRWNTDTDDDEE